MVENIERSWCTRWTPTATGRPSSGVTILHLGSSAKTLRSTACPMPKCVSAIVTGLAAHFLR